MITFSNKTVRYNFSSEGENFKIDGTVEIMQNGSLNNLNASISNLQGQYLGNLYYSETMEGKCNKNLNNVEKENFADVDNYVDSILAELKTNIPE